MVLGLWVRAGEGGGGGGTMYKLGVVIWAGGALGFFGRRRPGRVGIILGGQGMQYALVDRARQLGWGGGGGVGGGWVWGAGRAAFRVRVRVEGGVVWGGLEWRYVLRCGGGGGAVAAGIGCRCWGAVVGFGCVVEWGWDI